MGWEAELADFLDVEVEVHEGHPVVVEGQADRDRTVVIAVLRENIGLPSRSPEALAPDPVDETFLEQLGDDQGHGARRETRVACNVGPGNARMKEDLFENEFLVPLSEIALMLRSVI